MLTFIVVYSQLSTRGATCSETFVLAFSVMFMECAGSALECRTRNRESPGSNPPLLPFGSLVIFVQMNTWL